MVGKYAHLSSEHLTEYVDCLSSLKLVGNDPGEVVTIGLAVKMKRSTLL
ncbi:hypothetical protein NTG1052_550034 [Candidatus Nitrotoga sp. 1052]|nr:hypothetical protein NTG1052_550034 [Candidatus Nitrotoga sp. 1052]